jgi:hypothetical protein
VLGRGAQRRPLGVIRRFIGDLVQQADELAAFGRSELLQFEGHVLLLLDRRLELKDVLAGGRRQLGATAEAAEVRARSPPAAPVW